MILVLYWQLWLARLFDQPVKAIVKKIDTLEKRP